jgi:hypothetical protein
VGVLGDGFYPVLAVDLTEMSTRNICYEVKVAGAYG